ncbi:MAG TPA: GDP-mannose 4,6-dehydratase [Gemmatimonadales bacterium]
MKVLVTGADGFVGRELVSRLEAAGHDVAGAVRPGNAAGTWRDDARRRGVTVLDLELEDPASVARVAEWPADAVVHLAAVASSREARQDPGLAWTVNAAGTARILEGLAAARERSGRDTRVLVVSSGEVYGDGPHRPRVESDPVAPQSPYAASKAAAELAAHEVARRTGLAVIVARAFQHTGPGQSEAYVVPALARRLAEARRNGRRQIPAGNLDPVRDITDVRDVVSAYVALLEGAPAGTYNVSRGEGFALRDILARLAAILGVEAEPVTDPALARRSDIPHLVGDPARLRAATGWSPAYSIERTLRDVVDAQAD